MSTDGVDEILCIKVLMVSYQAYRCFVNLFKHFLAETRRRDRLFYTHDVLSKRSVSMIYNVTNIKLIYLIFLKEILSVDIQIVYIVFRG